MLSRLSLGHAEAQRAIAAILVELTRRDKAAVVAVADAHGEVIALLRMDGAPVSSSQIAMNKAWTAARERKPTGEIGRKARDPQTSFEIAWFGDPRYTGWGGGVPVMVNGAVVGAVAVSGLSQGEDVELAMIGMSVCVSMEPEGSATQV